MSTPIAIAVQKIKCFETNDFIGSDEPYVLVAGIDLTVTPLPNVEVTLYGPWGNVNGGDTAFTWPIVPEPPNSPIPPAAWAEFFALDIYRHPFWALDNKTAKAIEKPGDVIFLAAVMENDDGNPKSYRELAKEAVVASLAASVGMPRATRVEKLKSDMDAALTAIDINVGFYSTDDLISHTRELALTEKDLHKAREGTLLKKLSFDGDSGSYQVFFELSSKVPLP